MKFEKNLNSNDFFVNSIGLASSKILHLCRLNHLSNCRPRDRPSEPLHPLPTSPNQGLKSGAAGLVKNLDKTQVLKNRCLLSKTIYEQHHNSSTLDSKIKDSCSAVARANSLEWSAKRPAEGWLGSRQLHTSSHSPPIWNLPEVSVIEVTNPGIRGDSLAGLQR